jgi:hypothetical protein
VRDEVASVKKVVVVAHEAKHLHAVKTLLLASGPVALDLVDEVHHVAPNVGWGRAGRNGRTKAAPEVPYGISGAAPF